LGKRELLLIVIFVAIGAVTYQFTAPPPKDGQGFSFSRLWSNARRGIQGGAQPTESVTQTGAIAVGTGVTELRVTGVNRGIQILGETRRDIAYELTAESSGPDAATAKANAGRVVLKQDVLGAAIAIEVTYPRAGSQWAKLTLHVPARLAVRLQGGSGARAVNLAALELDRVSGITTAEDILGAVTGVLSGSELTIAGAGAVNLTLAASRARLSRIARGVTASTRAGRCEITDSQGAVAIDETNTEISITHHAGTIRTSGTGGRVTIDDPQQSVEVNVRNAPISLTLGAAVAVSVFAAGERVRVTFEGAPAVTVDAVAGGGGHIDASDFGLSPESADPDQEQRLTHAFAAAGAPRVTLRNSRGDIVIAKRK
jgi:hypothetical protein